MSGQAETYYEIQEKGSADAAHLVALKRAFQPAAFAAMANIVAARFRNRTAVYPPANAFSGRAPVARRRGAFSGKR